ncbi:MAG TPA: enolase C-terminal domain-like protein [Roseomonas sp.]
MKISDVSLTLFDWPLPKAPLGASSYGSRQSGISQLGLLTIATDDGVEGHAFLGSSVHSADLDGPSLVRHLKPVLIGQNPLERERLSRAMWQWRSSRLTTSRAIGAVDVVLWDIVGKVAGLPVHHLLGGCRDRIPAYASSVVLPSPEAYAEEALRYKQAGWRAYKIHPPQRWRDDIAVCTAVRRAVGDDYDLMLDSMWGYSFDEAMRVGRALEELGFRWFEDPLGENDLYNYARLREKLDVPLMATEYPTAGLDTYAAWITAKATDILRGDVAVKGGLTTLIKAAHLAEAFGMKLEVHHGANSHANLANLHVEMAIANCEFHEVMLPDTFQKYGLVRDIEVDADGMVHAPQGPGLGAEIDFDLIRSRTVTVLR